MAVTNFLDDIFNCRADNMPPEFVYHNFWGFDAQKELSAFGPFRTCVKRAMVQIKSCLRLIPRKCHGRFDPGGSSLGHCHSGMRRTGNNTKQGNAFRAYHKCVGDITEKYHCHKVFHSLCSQQGFRGVKTVRGTMASVGGLLERNPNLRVIHLIRDPRAVVLSRQHFDESGRGLYSGSDGEENLLPSSFQVAGTRKVTLLNNRHGIIGKFKQQFDIVKESKLYCSSVARDVRMRKELEKRHPGALVEVIYDDFVQAPLNYTEKLYDFIGVDMSGKTRTGYSVKREEQAGKEKQLRFPASGRPKSRSYNRNRLTVTVPDFTRKSLTSFQNKIHFFS